MLNRRHFLSTSLGGMSAALTLGSTVFGQQIESFTEGSNPAIDGFEPSTLFLTWQRDPTSTMTIQWLGHDTSAQIPILYSSVHDPVWQFALATTKPFPNTDLKVFRCELTGLKDGADYQFHVGQAAKTYYFRTMPKKATNTIQFVSGGDSGVDLHAQKSNLMAAKQDPYFALIGGDLAYDNGRAPKTFVTFLQNYRKLMFDSQGRMIPLISCIGNHEVDGAYKQKREKSPQYLSVFDGFFSEKTYGVLDVGDYLSIVLLDTDHIEPIPGEQTDWLGKTLADRQERPHLIVANHVPAYPSYRPIEGVNAGDGTGAEQRTHWCPLFERYNVDVVLEHHDHTFKRTFPLTNGLKDKNGVLYLGDGSWGKLRPPKSPQERPYLAASSAAYHVTLHRLEGEQRFHMALEDNGRVADICMTNKKRPAKRG